MNVAVVAPLVAPIGAPEPYGNHALLIDLATGLARRGHRVRVYAAEGSRVPFVEVVECPVDARARGAFIHAQTPATQPIPGMRESFEELFRRLREDGADAVSQHAFDAEAIELAEGLPVVHTLHMPPIVPEVVRACVRSSAPVVAVSEHAARLWRAAGVARVKVIRNGVPPLRALRGAPEPVALVAGRICAEKGTAIAIRAALEAGLDARVVGTVYDAPYFEREVKPLLGDLARLEPCVPRDALRRTMATCAVCLMPVAWDEPFGLVAAEAQLAGCPVVAYARGALPEIIEQGVSGLVVRAGDERALVDAIRVARAFDRDFVRESARRRLHIDAMLDAYERALYDVAGRCGARRHG